MSNNIIPMPTQRAGKSALDEFLPEVMFTPEAHESRGEKATPRNVHLSPDEVQLDPIESVGQMATTRNSSVQLWPMLAAALVAIGVSILALAAFGKFSLSAL